MTPFLLGLIGLCLAYPAPQLLGHASWPYQAPRAAILLWQSLAVATILATLGAGLATALWLVTAGNLTTIKVLAHFAVLLLTAVVAVRLAWSLVTVARETRKRRHRQRTVVDLLATRDGAAPGLRILEEQTPVAFCLPDRAHARVILTRGALECLGADELTAVLEHEHAHVHRRHDLVLEGSIILHRAFPRVRSTDSALRQSQILVELLADDAARKATGAAPLARALVTLSAGPIPQGSLGAGNATALRLAQLESSAGEHCGLAALAYALAATVLIGPTLGLAVPWIIGAWRILNPS